MSKIVKRKIDLSKPPRLSARRRAELKVLLKAPEEKIDYSDIPATSRAFWAVAEQGRFYKPIKKSTTIRVDADVLDWLKSQGKGYQTRLNAILRSAMLRSAGRR